ncbi:DUF2971 domain-containing protein [Uliginosibacterium sp. H1]|uniref:DUF2971 domain-containing protein n=1 Tax=Uliginosibacterium sp. H1 TaxID=3114757 RepID=UPI002E1898A9|nr:DUF2971 domain-containing protein [Uliginosibacterium sp. H1]
MLPIGDFSDLHDRVLSVLSSSEATPPSTLYHYTSAAGLLGMIQGKSLHATHYAHLNDRVDGIFGMSVLEKQIDTLARDLAIESTGLPDTRYKPSYFQDGNDLFVCCFSSKFDHHGQWMEYGDRGQGYALEFSSHGLATIGRSHGGSTQPRLLKVLYKKDEQDKLIAHAKELTLAFIKERAGSCSSKYEKDVFHSNCLRVLAENLYLYCFAMKDPRFADEEEWRLCIPMDRKAEEQISFRSGKYGITPYIELCNHFSCSTNRSHLPIVNIYPGPNVDEYSAKQAWRLLKWKTSAPGHMQDYSSLPIRR